MKRPAGQTYVSSRFRAVAKTRPQRRVNIRINIGERGRVLTDRDLVRRVVEGINQTPPAS